jgi:large subunit ribosomal protein L5
MSQTTETTMKKISLEKVVLNMGIGKSGDVINIAKKALDEISGKKSSSRNAKAQQRDWGVRKGEPIGAAVTVRGDDAIALVKRLLESKGNEMNG